MPSILTPDLGLLFWMFLAFMTVFLLLWKYGFPVILQMVEKRQNYIDESLQKAHEANEKLMAVQQECEKMMQSTREKQAALLKEIMATRDAIVSEARKKAADDAATIIADAKAQIEAEKQNALRSIRGTVAELSVQISEKILRQKLESDAAQQQYIQRLLDDVTVK